jgi:hypothetical protein
VTATGRGLGRYSDDDLYRLLHVTPDADPQLIQLGYRLAALEAHPDTGGTRQRMQMLNRAKEILLDPQQRAEYDFLRARQNGHRASTRTDRDEQRRVVSLQQELSDRDQRLAACEQAAHRLERTCERLELIEKQHRAVTARLREVSATLASAQSVAGTCLLKAVDALLAPFDANVDPVEPLREVLVLADRPRPRAQRRLVAVALGIGLIVGGVGGLLLAASTCVPG